MWGRTVELRGSVESSGLCGVKCMGCGYWERGEGLGVRVEGREFRVEGRLWVVGFRVLGKG